MNNKFDIHAIKIFHYFHAQEKCINTIIYIPIKNTVLR